MQPITRARALTKILHECQIERTASGELTELLHDGETELLGLLADLCAWQADAVKEREVRRLLFDLVPTALLFVDEHGVITEMNPAAIELLGRHRCGHHLEEAVSFADATREDGDADAVDMGFGFSRRQNAPVRVTGHPTRDGTNRRLLVVRTVQHQDRGAAHMLLRPIRRAPPLGGLRVLVVDHDPTTRAILTEVLSTSGAQVTAATSAAEGLCVLEAFELDMLVSDIVLPELDGYGFIEQVRDAGIRVPALALARRAAELDAPRARRAGYDVCLVDFPSYGELVRCLRQFVGQTVAATRARVPTARLSTRG